MNGAVDASNARACGSQREMLRCIAGADRLELWRGTGARDMAAWLCIRYGISEWKARRWIAAAHAPEELPELAAAFSRGELGIDKVVELCRFATPETEGALHVDARRADALMALASARIAEDPDADRATIVVHARVEGSRPRSGVSYEIEDGPVIHPETVRRLLCHARVQAVVQDSAGNVTGVGRMRREPTAWMLRQLRYRDSGCTFPGCGTRRFLHAHHIVWWERGGRIDLDNLTLDCSFHHKLVHEYGWRLRREPGGEVGWFRPRRDPVHRRTLSTASRGSVSIGCGLDVPSPATVEAKLSAGAVESSRRFQRRARSCCYTPEHMRTL